MVEMIRNVVTFVQFTLDCIDTCMKKFEKTLKITDAIIAFP